MNNMYAIWLKVANGFLYKYDTSSPIPLFMKQFHGQVQHYTPVTVYACLGAVFIT